MVLDLSIIAKEEYNKMLMEIERYFQQVNVSFL